MRFTFLKFVFFLQSIAVCTLILSVPGLTPSSFGEELNDFSSFSFLDNQTVNSEELRGNILVMVFGSIYCKPCVKLLPVMNMLHERYQDSDVRIILLDIDMAVDPALQREFVERHALKDPYINNALQIARDNKVYMLPTTLIVDREGSIVKRIYGFKKIRKFESVIKKLHPIIKGPKDPENIEASAGTGDNATIVDTGAVESAGEPVHQEHHP